MLKKALIFSCLILLSVTITTDYHAKQETKQPKQQQKITIPTVVTRQTISKYKQSFLKYISSLKRSAKGGKIVGAIMSWGGGNPDSLLQTFGGKHATLEELKSLNRLFEDMDNNNETKVRDALANLGSKEEDVTDLNEIFVMLKKRGTHSKDDLIDLIHPKNLSRAGLPTDTPRPVFIKKAQNSKEIDDAHYFRGMVFALFALHLFDEDAIK